MSWLTTTGSAPGRPRLPAPPAPGYRPEVLATLFGSSKITGEA